MVRAAPLLLALVTAAAAAACGARDASGPAWPKPHAREADGGESLAPRQASAATAIEAAADATPAGAGAGSAAAPPAAASTAPALTDGTWRPASEVLSPGELDVLMTEELIIEIED